MNEATIRLHVESLEEGGYVATSPDVPGLVAQGNSVSETVEYAQDIAHVIAEMCIEHGLARTAAAGPVP
jgi:predicted RNase H-like HicB family nuclease